MPYASILGPVETSRLVLRASRPSDAVVFHQLWTERDPRVPPHRRIDAEGHPTVDDITADVAGADPSATGPRLVTVALRTTGDVLGYCGLIEHGNGSPAEPELAYELVRAAHGQGYATEAGRAVVDWADEAGYRRLWAGVWSWNVASRRVLDKLGFGETERVGASSVHGRTILTVRELPSVGRLGH